MMEAEIYTFAEITNFHLFYGRANAMHMGQGVCIKKFF